ncbi:hypothetical protein HYPSUDRAFT_136874, partial [Hypholoma sublateritium FD-334 SS-4]
SAVETTRAFYKCAVIAHQLTNCLTRIFKERALARATELDEILRETGKTVWLLHGPPVSLKGACSIGDCIYCVSTSYVSGIGQYADHDSVIIEILHKCGAVPFVRTYVSQTLMMSTLLSPTTHYLLNLQKVGETHSNVFGRTLNPYNCSLTSGGSSDWESAPLIAIKGSPPEVGMNIVQ